MSEELNELILSFAAIGSIADGGVCRITGTDSDGEARRLFKKLAKSKGAEFLTDAIGNQYARFRLGPNNSESILCGSHLDTQPLGGRYDGTLGVLSAMLAAEEIFKLGIQSSRDLVVVNWTNEEGVRFRPAMMGSAVSVGHLSLSDALLSRDKMGISVRGALESIGAVGKDVPTWTTVAYVEAHIEQGSRLLDAGRRIGVVTGGWPDKKMKLSFSGEPAHTGPSAMSIRRDALRAAALAIAALYRIVEESGSGAHCSAAQLAVEPDSSNTVPYYASMVVDIRHPQVHVLEELWLEYLSIVRNQSAQINVDFGIVSQEVRPGPMMDKELAVVVREAARECGEEPFDLLSIVGHDAFNMQKTVPSSLIFVPSQGGISHSPKEFTTNEDVSLTQQVMTGVLLKLVSSPTLRTSR